MLLNTPFDAQTAACLPVFLDGLLGQEDELEDVNDGDDEPTPGDISSGASNRTRVPNPEPDLHSEPHPEPKPTSSGGGLSKQPNEFDRFDRRVQDEELDEMAADHPSKT